ncbi:angiopoietin-1 receptor-like [Strongylocentrotus purpuratus]|uniref:Fibronectin type-III domain-containing protein n=1 Tax=Strongylocentrotus purpuratus TaxID=7668 RepID=A0A7M7N764_STRPU|nr:angiopoietin-1 receptor-like [Strongylocentrotus purpuratus]
MGISRHIRDIFKVLLCEVVHITVLTVGYTNIDTSNNVQYQCYPSEPDADATLSFGRSAPITTDRSPPADERHSTNPLVRDVTFPAGDWDSDGFGPFYCEASKPDRDVTRVTTFFQRSDAKFISSNGLFTQTVNVNDIGVMISMDSRINPDESDNVITWMKDGSEVLTSFDGQTQISFPNPIQTSDQGIYEIYYDNERDQNRGGLYRLIVRECTAGKWGPPECYGICDKCYNGGVCHDKSGLCICPNNFKGTNCLEIPDECEDGYYGSQCTDKCHCLNDEPCDDNAGECPEQKCALGYIPAVRSGQTEFLIIGTRQRPKINIPHIRTPARIRTGNTDIFLASHVQNLECEGGTFGLDCLQQCNCAPEACETERGFCKGQCLDSWIGPYCQRISRLVPVRVNPYRPSTFTCYVEGNPPPDASSVDLYRRTGSTNDRTGITRRSSTVSGSERAVVFDVDNVFPQEVGGYECSLTFENIGYPSTPITNPTYVLPVIEKAPVIVSTMSTTVGLQWNAWSEEDDKGDPPLVGYDVFVNKDDDWVTDQRVDQLTTSTIVSNLIPDTEYMFRIAAVREGTGGTGPMSPRDNTITRCGKPSASPTGLLVSAINPKELDVTWEHSPSESAECRSGVTHYMIYYAIIGSTSSNSILVSRDDSSYLIRGLETYLDYTIQISASNKDEESDRSSEIIGKTLEEVAPSPINVAIPQSTTSSFTVSWSTPLPSNINGNIQKYIIRFKQTDPVVDDDFQMEEVLNGAFEGEHTVVDLTAKSNYSVQVQTVNGAGSSNWSEPVNAKAIQSAVNIAKIC